MNPQIQQLHARLIAAHAHLAARLGRSADQDEAEAILREMEELNFRVMMAGRLLFKTTTARIDRRLAAVVEASDDLDRAIASTAGLGELITGIGRFLTRVDRVLDTIKLR
jgi:hypothetical protein